jgi:hypothetical protein
MPRRRVLFAIPLLAVWIGASGVGATTSGRLPARLTDQEFWTLIDDISEPSGTFRSDNLLSNEGRFQYVIPELVEAARPGGVYMGVGPEQNFTYMVALKPAMAFIVDIRRGNLDLHLVYKALFEMSADRADFVSKLFSRKRPAGLTEKSTAEEIFDAFADAERSDALYTDNLKAIQDLLVKKHGFALSDIDQSGLEYVYSAFSMFGPKLQYSSTGAGFFGGGQRQPSYADLMVGTDADNVSRSYLASEQNFRVLKDLEAKNLLVPVVGNFAGPKAIRSVGRYLKDKGGVVSAFYLSNVEMYLSQDGLMPAFCRNVATLPLDETSTFIRSLRGGRYGQGFGLNSQLGGMAAETERCR